VVSERHRLESLIPQWHKRPMLSESGWLPIHRNDCFLMSVYEIETGPKVLDDT